MKWLLFISIVLILFGVGVLAFEYFRSGLPLTLPEVVGDANPVLRTERRFNDSVSIVKRNETISKIGSKEPR